MTEKDRAIDAAVNLILSITQHGDSPIEHLEKAVTELFDAGFMMGYDDGYADAEDVLDSAGL
jgi:hypothetical protein